MPSRRQRKMDELRKVLRIIGESTPDERKSFREELAKYPDPPGEEELKGPYDGPDGEYLRK